MRWTSWTLPSASTRWAVGRLQVVRFTAQKESVPPSSRTSGADVMSLDLKSLSPRDVDLFLQYSDFVEKGVGSVPVRHTARVIGDIVSAALWGTPSHAMSDAVGVTLLEMVLLPGGAPCTGWFGNGYGNDLLRGHMQRLWRTVPHGVWHMQQRNVTAAIRAQTDFAPRFVALRGADQMSEEDLRATTQKHVAAVLSDPLRSAHAQDRYMRVALGSIPGAEHAQRPEERQAFIEALGGFPALSDTVMDAALRTCLHAAHGFQSLESSVAGLGEDTAAVLSPRSLTLLRALAPPSAPTALSPLSRHGDTAAALLDDCIGPHQPLLQLITRLTCEALTQAERCHCAQRLEEEVLSLTALLSAAERRTLSLMDLPSRADEAHRGAPRGAVGLLDAASLARYLEAPAADATGEADADPLVAHTAVDDSPFPFMPSLGTDASRYWSQTLLACDALCAALSPPAAPPTPLAVRAQRLRHLLRVSIFRRFAVRPLRLWAEPCRAQAFPFLLALHLSLAPSRSLVVLRFDGVSRSGDNGGAAATAPLLPPHPQLQPLAAASLLCPHGFPCVLRCRPAGEWLSGEEPPPAVRGRLGLLGDGPPLLLPIPKAHRVRLRELLSAPAAAHPSPSLCLVYEGASLVSVSSADEFALSDLLA